MHFIKQRAAMTTHKPESHLQLLIPQSKFLIDLNLNLSYKGIILNIPGLTPPLQPNPQASGKPHQPPPPPTSASRHRLASRPPPKLQPPRGPLRCSSLAPSPAPNYHNYRSQSTTSHCDHAFSVRSNLPPPIIKLAPLVIVIKLLA